MHVAKNVSCGILALLCWAPDVASQSALRLNLPAYNVSQGGTTRATASCTSCVFASFMGYLTWSTFDPNIATVSPTSVGPITSSPFGSTVTITGVAEGSTTLQCVLTNSATTIVVVRASVSVVIGGAGGCPATLSLAGDPQQEGQLDLLRRYRDSLQTPRAREYRRLFYEHAPETTRLLAGDAVLRRRARDVLTSVLPAIGARLDGRPARITAAQRATIEAFLDAAAPRASDRLRATMARFRGDLQRHDLLAELGERRQAPIVQFGTGCPGSLGVPQIETRGSPKPGADFGLQLVVMPPRATAFLGVSTARADHVLGGCTIGPELPFDAILHAATDAWGVAQFALPMPRTGLPGGAQLFVQGGALDSAGALFGAASLTPALRVAVERGN